MITVRPAAARILVLDPGQTERRSLSLPLADNTLEITEVNTLDSALAVLATGQIHLVLVRHDAALPDPQELIRRVRRLDPAVEILLVLPAAPPGRIAAALEAGAFDCVAEPPSTEALLARARKAIEHRELKVRLAAVRQHVAMHYSFDNLVGVSRAAQQLREALARLAPTDIAVLITGPEGSGKELCASILHHHSGRRQRPYVVVDCTAPEPVLVPELFGSEGSDRPGLLVQADGGTVLLRRLDRMPAAVQERLAEVLKTGVLPGRPARLNVRWLSTSALSAGELAAAGVRRDLLAKLDTITVAVPPLRERIEDLEPLVAAMLRRIAAETGRTRLDISRAALDRLLHWPWPGNARELESCLRRAAALAGGETIDSDAVVFAEHRPGAAEERPLAPRTNSLRLADNQRDLIEKVLIDNNWNYTQTAQELGIGRTTLWRKVKKYNLKPGVAGEAVRDDG